MTITLTREEAEHVLKLLDKFDTFNDFTDVRQPLRAKLSEPEPEPVAWTVSGLITDFSRDFSAYQTKTYTRPLYTAPPQREWQGLTDEEIRNEAKNHVFDESFFSGAVWARGQIMGRNNG